MARSALLVVAFLILATLMVALPAVAAGPATHRLHVEVTWDDPVPVRLELIDIDSGVQSSGARAPYTLYAVMSETDKTNTLPNSHVTIDVQTQSGTFDVDPTDGGRYVIYASIDLPCPLATDFRARWFYDGCLVVDATSRSSNCYQDQTGLFSPDLPCLPRLYVDVDNNFNPSNHTDDLSRYVPGATLAGTSVSPSSMPQLVRLVAVAARNVSGTVKFDLVPGSVSKFPGIAMNYPIDGADVSDDAYFMVPKDPKKPSSGLIKGTSASASLNNGVAITTLYVNDYAAWATVQATIPTGRTTTTSVTIRIPRDADGNRLPDSGWTAIPRSVIPGDSSLLQPASVDLDFEPSGPLQEGDGLSAYEEYRGFVLRGNHVRLNPHVRDLFIDIDPQMNREIVDLLPFNLLFVNPDEVKGEDVTRTTSLGSTTLQRIKPVINPNRAAVGGTAVPGSLPAGQRALRIIRQELVFPMTKMGDNLEHEVWKIGIGGFAFSDLFSNLNVTNGLGNPDPTQAIDVKAVNKTQFVEYYVPFFSNYGVSTDFRHDYFDKNRNQVTNCTLPLAPNCDAFDTARGVIYPVSKDGFEVRLNTVIDEANFPDDFYTKPHYFPDCNTGLKSKFSELEWQLMQAAIVGHEAAHGVDVPHQAVCGELMYYVRICDATNTCKNHGLVDQSPLPSDYSFKEMELMRLWEP